MSIQQYWNAADFAMEPSWVRSEPMVIDTCRQLLVDSVRQRVVGGGATWAQLSGGLDSSSVVSLAQWLAERGDVLRRVAAAAARDVEQPRLGELAEVTRHVRRL